MSIEAFTMTLRRLLRILLAAAAAIASGSAFATPSVSDLALTAQVARKLTQQQLMQQAAYVLVSESTTDTDGYPLPPARADGTGPTGGGVIPSSSAAPKTDGYGVKLGYCAWDNGSVTNHAGYIAGTLNMAAVTLAVVSPGADNTFQTTCAQIASGSAASGDDSYVAYTAGQILSGVRDSTYFADPVNTVADLSSITPSALKDGQVRLVKATNTLYRYNGTAWGALTVAWQNAATPGDIYYSAGKVGIGTTTPTVPLDVTGTANVSGAITAGSLNTASIASSLSLALATAGSTRLFIDASGNVGIATTSPAALLDVNGAAKVGSLTSTGTITAPALTSSGALTLTGTTVAINGPTTVSGLLTASDGLSATTGTFSGALAANGGMTATTGAYSGALSANGGLSSTTGTFSGALAANGGLTATTGAFGGALSANGGLLSTTGSFSGALAANSGLTSTTGAFSGALSANGGLSSTTGSFSGALAANGGLTSTTGAFSGALAANGGMSSTTGSFSGALAANGGLTSTTGAFSGALSANGGLSSTTGTFSGGLTATTGTFSGALAASSVTTTLLGTTNASPLSLITGNTSRLFIDASGNIGINRVIPNYKLDVNGTANFDGALTANNGATVSGTLTATTVAATSAMTVGGNAVWHAGNFTPGNYVLKAGDTMTGQLVADGGIGATSYLPIATAGSERLRIDASGNVGIAKTAPSYKLDVAGPIRADSAGTSAGLYLGDGSGTNVGQFWYDSTVPRVTLEARGATTKLSLATNGAQRMVIDTSGNVGIGTTSPGFKLHIVDSVNDTKARFADGSAVKVDIGTSSANSTGFIGTSTNYPFVITTNGVERLRIDTAGNVGIGTTPAGWSAGFTPLQIENSSLAAYDNGSGTMATQMSTNVYQTTAAYNDKRITAYGALRYLQDLSSGHVWSHAAAGAAGGVISWGPDMVISTAGNVGIGKWVASYPLDVLGAVRADSAGSAGGIFLGNGSATNVGQLWYDSVAPRVVLEAKGATMNLAFATNGSERLRVDTSGNVGIAKTAPAYALDVAGQIRADNAGGFLLANGSATNVGKLSYDGTSVVTLEALGARALAFNTNGAATARMYIDSTGKIGIGNTAPAYKLDVTGAIRADNASGVLVTDGAGTNMAQLAYAAPGGTPTASLEALGATDLRLRTNSVDRLHIDSTGNVAVGITSALAAKFSVRNGGGFDTLIGSGANYDNYLTAGSAGVNVFRHGNTEDARFDSSGNLGIGKTAPGYKLDVLGAIRSDSSGSSAGFWLGNGSGTNVGQFWYDPTTTPVRTVVEARGATTNLSFATNGAERMRIDTGGRVGIGGAAPGGSFMLGVTGAAFVSSTFTAASVGTDTGLFYSNGNIPLILQGGGKEGLRIDNNTGYVGVNKTNPGVALDVAGTIRTNSQVTLCCYVSGGVSNDAVNIYYDDTVGNKGAYIDTQLIVPVKTLINGGWRISVNPTTSTYALDVNGVTHATSFSTASDARLKHNIVTLDQTQMLSRFLQVRPVHYTLNATGSQHYGYIAQELLPLFPEMVTQGNDGIYGVEYTQMLPIVTSVVQQQQQALQQLQATKLGNLVGQWASSSDNRGRFLFEDGGKTVIKGHGDTAVELRNAEDAVVASFNRNGDLALAGALRFNSPVRNGLAFDATGTIVSSDTPGQIVVSAARAARAAVRLQAAPETQASNARIFGSVFGDDNGVGLADAAGHALLTARSTPAGGQVAVSGTLVVGDADNASSTIRLAGQTAIQAPGDGSLQLAAASGVRVFNPATKEVAVTLGSDGTVQARTFVPTRVVDPYSACAGQAGAIARDASGQLVACMQ